MVTITAVDAPRRTVTSPDVARSARLATAHDQQRLVYIQHRPADRIWVVYHEGHLRELDGDDVDDLMDTLDIPMPG